MATPEVIAQCAVIPNKKCDLCEDNNITFKCLNCDELICDYCKKIHLKSKISKDHKVVNLLSADVRQSNHGNSGKEANAKSPEQHTDPVPQSRHVTTSTSPQTTDVKLFGSFTFIWNRVEAVRGKDQAWSWMWGETGIYLETSAGKTKQTVRSEFNIYDAAVSLSGDLLVSVHKGYTVKKHKRGNTFKDIYKAEPGHEPRGITVTNTGNILVVLYGSKGSKVVEITLKGELIRTIQYDSWDNKVLFDRPRFICTNINGDILVADYYKVVVVDKYGHRRFIYDGGDGRGLKKSFDSYDVVTDKHGHIFISDRNNSVIHKLDQDGKFIRFITTTEYQCPDPVGLAVDVSGRLWVAGDGMNKVIVLDNV